MEALGKVLKVFFTLVWKLFIVILWGILQLSEVILKQINELLKNYLSKK
jgi:hypothetical protein